MTGSGDSSAAVQSPPTVAGPSSVTGATGGTGGKAGPAGNNAAPTAAPPRGSQHGDVATQMAPRRRWLPLRQAFALTRKNILMRLRFPGLLLGQLVSAVAFVGLIWLVDAAIRYSDAGFGGRAEQRSPAPRRVGPVPLCSSNQLLQQGARCYTFLYTPAGDPWVEEVVAGVRAANQPPIPADQVRGFANMSEVDSYLWANPQTVLAAVHFRRRPAPPTPPGSAPPRALSFVVQSNATAAFFKGRFQDPNTYVAIPLQVAVEAQMARLATADPSLPWSVSLADFPHPSLATASAVGRFAPTFLLASVVINFVVLLTNMVSERETGTRSALAAMGLRDSAHWVSWVVPEVLLTAAHSAVLLGALVAMRFPLALRNSPALVFLLLWGSELSMGGVALVLSAVLRRSASAVPAGFATYIVCWALQLVVQFGFPYHPGVAQGWVALFSCLPPCLLTKGLQDLANAALGTGKGISWSHRDDYCWQDPPPPYVRTMLPYWQSECIVPVGQIVWLLPLQAAGFTILAAYLDGVLPREEGSGGQPLWGPLLGLLPPWLRLGGGERSRRARSGRRAAAALERALRDQQHQQLLLLLKQQEQQQQQQQPAWPSPGSGTAVLPPLQEQATRESAAEGSAATAAVPGGVVQGVRSAGGLSGLRHGMTDPGVAVETAVVQSICRAFVADVRQADKTEADATAAAAAAAAAPSSPSALEHMPYSDIGPAADSVFGGAGGDHGSGEATAVRQTSAAAYVAATAWRAPYSSKGSRHGLYGPPDWREGVVLFGLRKEYGGRGWFAAVASWCCGWLSRRRRRWEPAAATRPTEPAGGTAAAATAAASVAVVESSSHRPPAWQIAGMGGSGGGAAASTSSGGDATKTGGRRGPHVAVYGTWLRIVPGECFCLLGPNGAGKTTTIKSLIGAVRPTSGEALVYGTSVLDAEGLDAARGVTGICPQFDVLWGALSGREHLALMADVRGLPWSQRRGEVERMLRQVRLEAAADRPAGSYSGGMRRRLSVAAALLGDPRVVYLDEPTTGMDPVSRSHVWELISAAKAGRCLVLTTHSMEEAEVLGDRIAILAAGRLRCLGHSLALKRRYGGGYRVAVGLRELQEAGLPPQAGPGREGAARDDAGDRGASADGSGSGDGGSATAAAAAVEEAAVDSLGLEGGLVAEVGRSHVHLQVPRDAEMRLPELFERLQADRDKLGIVDIQIKLSSLEDVYLEVVRQWR